MFKTVFKWTILATFGAIALLAILFLFISLVEKWRDRESFSVNHHDVISGTRTISSYRQAAEFALSSDSLKREFEKCDRVRPEDSWMIIPQLENDIWTVRAHWKQYVGFGYKCSFAFDKIGNTIEAPSCSYYTTK